MLADLRDWLRSRGALAGVDVALRGDTTQSKLPRVRLFGVDDPRIQDLDGEGEPRLRRVQLDVYAAKGQQAADVADDVETALAAARGQQLGTWNVLDVEIMGAIDGPPEPSPSGDNEPVNRVILEAMLICD